MTDDNNKFNAIKNHEAFEIGAALGRIAFLNRYEDFAETSAEQTELLGFCYGLSQGAMIASGQYIGGSDTSSEEFVTNVVGPLMSRLKLDIVKSFNKIKNDRGEKKC